MKRIVFCILISTAGVLPAAAQSSPGDIEELSQPLATFNQKKDNSHALFAGTKTFESSYSDRTTRLELNPDSTFYFFSEFEGGYFSQISIGNWGIYHDSVIVFNTNNPLTTAAAPAAKTEVTWPDHLPTRPVKLDHWAFVEKNGILHLADGPESDRARIFKGYKSCMFYPIKSTAAQKEEDRKQNMHNGEGDIGSLRVSFKRKIPEDVYAVFNGEVILATEIDIDTSFVAVVKYDDYYITYAGIERSNLYKGKYIRVGEKISSTVKDLDGNFTLDLYMSNRYKQLQPFEWLEQ